MLGAARHEVDIEMTTDRGRVAGDHLKGRHVAGILDARRRIERRPFGSRSIDSEDFEAIKLRHQKSR
jgi:hypothetical protein